MSRNFNIYSLMARSFYLHFIRYSRIVLNSLSTISLIHQGEQRLSPPAFTSALDGVERSASRLGSFTIGELPPAPIGYEAG
jgi:hypothetical protein